MVLGGCYLASPTHAAYYLVSPKVNAVTATKLTLSYQRWLTSDYTPYVNNTVEVYNGTSWVQIWTSGASPGIIDTSWQPASFDITTYKNANLQVRWGEAVGSTSAIAKGGWNIDDVKIVSGGSCP